MGKTKIEWVQGGNTWNPVTGCTKISPGCKNCYAERMSKRLRGRCGYPADEPFRVTLHPERLEQPWHWKKPRRVFVCSMGDLFHDDVPFEFVDKIFETIAGRKKHTFLMLTKRPERLQKYCEKTTAELNRTNGASPFPFNYNNGFSFSNLWLGVTAENQEQADKRIPILLQIPAAVRFVSIEPMLGPVDLTQYLPNTWHCDYCGKRFPDGCYCGCKKDDCDCATDDFKCPDCGWDREAFNPLWPGAYDKNDFPSLDWVICGGESGPGARPMHSDWARSVRDQCQEAGVPFFLKQMVINGKMVKLPGLDGKQWREFPNAI